MITLPSWDKSCVRDPLRWVQRIIHLQWYTCSWLQSWIATQTRSHGNILTSLDWSQYLDQGSLLNVVLDDYLRLKKLFAARLVTKSTSQDQSSITEVGDKAGTLGALLPHLHKPVHGKPSLYLWFTFLDTHYQSVVFHLLKNSCLSLACVCVKCSALNLFTLLSHSTALEGDVSPCWRLYTFLSYLISVPFVPQICEPFLDISANLYPRFRIHIHDILPFAA